MVLIAVELKELLTEDTGAWLVGCAGGMWGVVHYVKRFVQHPSLNNQQTNKEKSCRLQQILRTDILLCLSCLNSFTLLLFSASISWILACRETSLADVFSFTLDTYTQGQRCRKGLTRTIDTSITTNPITATSMPSQACLELWHSPHRSLIFACHHVWNSSHQKI